MTVAINNICFPLLLQIVDRCVPKGTVNGTLIIIPSGAIRCHAAKSYHPPTLRIVLRRLLMFCKIFPLQTKSLIFGFFIAKSSFVLFKKRFCPIPSMARSCRDSR